MKLEYSNDERATSEPSSFGFRHSFVIRQWSFLSGRQPINLPRAVRQLRVPKAIMQPIQPPLPKLDDFGLQPITAPVRWQWNPFLAKPLSHLCHSRVEHTPGVDHSALARDPGPQLAAQRARMKIRCRFFA